MTKPNFTSINIILDGSGSMEKIRNDTINGVNKFLQEQKVLPGEATVSLHIFNTKYKTTKNELKKLKDELGTDTAVYNFLLEKYGHKLEQTSNAFERLLTECEYKDRLWNMITTKKAEQ